MCQKKNQNPYSLTLVCTNMMLNTLFIVLAILSATQAFLVSPFGPLFIAKRCPWSSLSSIKDLLPFSPILETVNLLKCFVKIFDSNAKFDVFPRNKMTQTATSRGSWLICFSNRPTLGVLCRYNPTTKNTHHRHPLSRLVAGLLRMFLTRAFRTFSGTTSLCRRACCPPANSLMIPALC